MADNKKYYYMRLKENYFDSSEISLLESMPNGYLYSNILLKLYLRSLRGEGRLAINDIPYSPEMIATVTHHPVETVQKALDIFQSLGLIEILDSGVIYMLHIQEFIGTSSTEADSQVFKTVSGNSAFPYLNVGRPKGPPAACGDRQGSGGNGGSPATAGAGCRQMLLIHLSVLGKGAENPCPPGSLHEPPLVAAECQGRSGHAAKEKIKKELPQTWEQPIAWDYYTSGRGGSQ